MFIYVQVHPEFCVTLISQQVLTNHQGSISIFSLSPKDRWFPRMQVCWGYRECGHQQATFEVASCGREHNSEKLSRETLSEFILNARLFSSNGFGSCMENLHAKELCRDWLRPCSVSSPLHGSSGCTRNGKVPCRQWHPRRLLRIRPHSARG